MTFLYLFLLFLKVLSNNLEVFLEPLSEPDSFQGFYLPIKYFFCLLYFKAISQIFPTKLARLYD